MKPIMKMSLDFKVNNCVLIMMYCCGKLTLLSGYMVLHL